ncbi:MAG TPA: GNAT family N-acetyltransferase [Candidatus Acidoferrum sp.]|nr:GNAT family N-acetyltransferase [Candidatus Acidoferrum sp.]
MPLPSSEFLSQAGHAHASAAMLPKVEAIKGTYDVPKRIRAFTLDDIPQVVDLHKTVFPKNSIPPPELEDHFRRLFFENPWYDEELPSYLYQEDGGKIGGFYGVIPRPMRMKGRPIRVAVSSQFMVDPSVRNRLAAVELQRAFFAGPQDLSLTDGANEASRKIWEGMGGSIAFPYSVHWTRLLSPTRYFLERWKERGLSAPVQWALRPISAAADFLAAHKRQSPFRQVEQPPEEDFTWETLLEQLPKFASTKSLYPHYDAPSLRWLLEQAKQKKCHGELRKSLVRNDRGQIVGWYMYYLNPNGVSQVLQLVATKKSIRCVLDRLYYHAMRLDSCAISGRMDPEFMADFSEERCLFSVSGPRVLVHSKRTDLWQAIQQGDTFLTRLEGEWWMRLQGG